MRIYQLMSQWPSAFRVPTSGIDFSLRWDPTSHTAATTTTSTATASASVILCPRLRERVSGLADIGVLPRAPRRAGAQWCAPRCAKKVLLVIGLRVLVKWPHTERLSICIQAVWHRCCAPPLPYTQHTHTHNILIIYSCI